MVRLRAVLSIPILIATMGKKKISHQKEDIPENATIVVDLATQELHVGCKEAGVNNNVQIVIFLGIIQIYAETKKQ